MRLQTQSPAHSNIVAVIDFKDHRPKEEKVQNLDDLSTKTKNKGKLSLKQKAVTFLKGCQAKKFKSSSKKVTAKSGSFKDEYMQMRNSLSQPKMRNSKTKSPTKRGQDNALVSKASIANSVRAKSEERKQKIFLKETIKF